MSESRKAYKIYFNVPLSRTSLGVSLGGSLIAKEYCYDANFVERSVTLRPGFEFDGGIEREDLYFRFPDGFDVSIKRICVDRVETVGVPF